MLLLNGSRADGLQPSTPKPRKLAVVQDEKMMESALRCARSITQAVSPILQIVRMAPVPLAALDTEMRYVTASQRWFDIFNLTRFCGVYENLQGKSHYEAFPTIEALKPEWVAFHKSVLETGQSIGSNGLDCFKDSDGSKIFLEWEIAPWFKDAANREVGGIILYCNNVKRVQDDQTVCPVCRATSDGQ